MSGNNNGLIIVGAAVVGYYFLMSREKEGDARKMDSQEVNQYRVGPYSKSYGKNDFADPNSKWKKIRDKIFGGGGLDGDTMDKHKRETNKWRF